MTTFHIRTAADYETSLCGSRPVGPNDMFEDYLSQADCPECIEGPGTPDERVAAHMRACPEHPLNQDLELLQARYDRLCKLVLRIADKANTYPPGELGDSFKAAIDTAARVVHGTD